MTTARKIRLDLMTPPEVALRAALAAIEAMPPDTRLTSAGFKVSEALDLVSSYIDEQMRDVQLDVEDNLMTPNKWRSAAEELAAKARGGAR